MATFPFVAACAAVPSAAVACGASVAVVENAAAAVDDVASADGFHVQDLDAFAASSLAGDCIASAVAAACNPVAEVAAAVAEDLVDTAQDKVAAPFFAADIDAASSVACRRDQSRDRAARPCHHTASDVLVVAVADSCIEGQAAVQDHEGLACDTVPVVAALVADGHRRVAAEDNLGSGGLASGRALVEVAVALDDCPAARLRVAFACVLSGTHPKTDYCLRAHRGHVASWARAAADKSSATESLASESWAKRVGHYARENVTSKWRENVACGSETATDPFRAKGS